MSVRADIAAGFLVLMAFDTLAQVSFRMAGVHAFPPQASVEWILRVMHQPWAYAAIAGYVGAFFTWISLLRRAPIGPAFAASHLEVVSVLAVSALCFGERIGPLQAAGALCIVAGIACLARSEHGAETGDA